MFINKIETASDLHNEFEAYGRGKCFTVEACEAMLDDTEGIEVELDIIELCGSYSEYDSPEDAYKDLYGEKQLNELKDDIKDSWLEYREENDKEMTDESLQSLIDKDIEEKILEELNDDYCCRELSNGNVLIQE